MRFLALILFLASILPAAFADTAFHYYSDVGDPIGQGKEQTVTPIDGNTIVPRSYFGRVGFDISNAASGDTYSMLFGPLYGERSRRDNTWMSLVCRTKLMDNSTS